MKSAVKNDTAVRVRVTRADLAIRHLDLSDIELRDSSRARVVALTEEMTRRLDGIEPLPAPPNTPAPPPAKTVDDALEHTLLQIRPRGRSRSRSRRLRTSTTMVAPAGTSTTWIACAALQAAA